VRGDAVSFHARSETGFHKVKMTVSREITAVRPAWDPATQTEVKPVNGAMAGRLQQDDRKQGNLQKEYDRLNAGYQIIRAIVGEDDVDTILDRIVRSVMDLLGVDRAAVLLATSEGGLEPKVALQKRESDEEFSISTSILSYVLENRSAVMCNDIASDARFAESKSIIMSNVRAAMCVPMLHEGELVGALHMDSHIATNPFDAQSLEVVRAIADTAAYVVRTAMLKNQIRNMERERAETMRAMMSGASHFINNPLAVIRANLGMMEEWSGTVTEFHARLGSGNKNYSDLRRSMGIDYIDEELAPTAADTGKAANRIGEIVRALYVFEQQDDASAWVDLDVAQLLDAVMHEHKESIEVVARMHLQLVPTLVHGVPDRLKTLLSNLVTNACQSIRAGSPENNWIVASCHMQHDLAIISIDDTGCGVPANRRHQIFAPFETERLDGSLGLGLAVAKEIAGQHKGQLTVSAREGGGTRMCLRMPLASSNSHS